ncbi:MAG: phytoene desaturase, partial [Actinobacteria bacterium]|nr:phytoene desaturase [Actinomycetota bacterium]
ESHGFRLDNGPTVLTMPNLLEDAFNAAGAEMREYVTIKKVDPMYRAVYEDGSELFVRHGREAMASEIARFSNKVEAASFHKFCDWLEDLYRAEMNSFIDTNFNSPLDLVRPWRDGLRLVQMGAFRKLDKKIGSFFRDDRLQRIFSFQSMYAGLAPYEALSLYAVITYMDSVEGVYFPEGGMHAMATGLAHAVTKAGVQIRYDSPRRTTRVLACRCCSGETARSGGRYAPAQTACRAPCRDAPSRVGHRCAQPRHQSGTRVARRAHEYRP